jgi:predicted GNAT family acetyltransferase
MRQQLQLIENTVESVKHNEAENRFEIDVDGELAVSQYRRRNGTIVFTHTEVPLHLEGQGIGNMLAKAALDYARSEGLRVVPRCRFIAAFIKRHRDYQDLVDPES